MTGLTAARVWSASDLARERVAIIAEAEHGAALVRSTSGTLLTLTAASRVAALEFVPRIAAVLGQAIALLDDEPEIAELGELAFAAGWEPARRATLAHDVRDVALHALATRNVAELDAFLEASRPRPATGPVDPARVAALLGG